MRAIQSTTWGTPPAFTPSASDLPPPTDSQVRLKVLASGLHRLVRAQALGNHYSAKSAGLPYTPGSDGVGLDESTGKRYYFVSIATGGGFAEYVNVARATLVELSEGADAVQVAGLVNPGMGGWMALTRRTKGVVGDGGRKGWTVVILGVTSQSGKVAVHFARQLGAGRVVGVARGHMDGLGLDEAIVLDGKDPAKTEWKKMGDQVDVILDYVYGDVAIACLNALESKVPTQFVQIGSMAGNDASWPAAVFRSKDITIRGSGPGAWAMSEFGAEAEGLVRAVEGLEKQALTVRNLEEVEEAWGNEKERTVFVP
jgi:NADPH:quinone reductase-like Zn-dependent oxidoreductase